MTAALNSQSLQASSDAAASGKKKRLLVLCPYPEGVAAGQRLKYEQYIDHWKASGFEVEIAPFMDMAMWNKLYLKGHTLTKALGTVKGYLRRCRDLLRLRRYDGVYIFMWVTPLGTSLFERLVAKLSRRMVYDVEDNIFVEKGNELNWFAKLLKSPAKTQVLVREADHVITSSPFLNEYCEKINKHSRCTFVTSSVDVDRYVAADKSTTKSPVVIGWTGTFTSRRFLDQLRPAFIKLRALRDFKLLVIGNFEYEFPEVDCEMIQWTKEREIEDLQRIDIGVYPLPKEDWVLGKSGLKVIQYMAMSLPTVSTNYGTAKDIVDHGQSGFLADDEDDWVRSLVQLIDDHELRKSLGTKARQTIEDRYSVNVINKQYLGVLNQVFK